jgi:hypothetical protein
MVAPTPQATGRLLAICPDVAEILEAVTVRTNIQFVAQIKKYYVSATEPNRLMLFGESVAAYCENHAEHRYSPYLAGNHYVSATEPDRLMLLWETVAVYCENRQEHFG